MLSSVARSPPVAAAARRARLATSSSAAAAALLRRPTSTAAVAPSGAASFTRLARVAAARGGGGGRGFFARPEEPSPFLGCRPRRGRGGGGFVVAFRRAFSSDDGGGGGGAKSIRIMYGSQGGTAQIFAMQLGDELDELASEAPDAEMDVTLTALNDPPGSPSTKIVPGSDVTNVVITSVTGEGDPPDNCKEFYEWIMNDGGDVAEAVDWSKVRYTVSGCGNSVAHTKNYNVIGKKLDKRLEELGAKRVHALGLGDDSDSIEDDFDTWQDSLIQRLTSAASEDEEGVVE